MRTRNCMTQTIVYEWHWNSAQCSVDSLIWLVDVYCTYPPTCLQHLSREASCNSMRGGRTAAAAGSAYNTDDDIGMHQQLVVILHMLQIVDCRSAMEQLHIRVKIQAPNWTLHLHNDPSAGGYYMYVTTTVRAYHIYSK